jgi:hypothetical protein
MSVAKVEDLREAAPWLCNPQSQTGSVIARVSDTALGMPRGTPQYPTFLPALSRGVARTLRGRSGVLGVSSSACMPPPTVR